MKKNRKTYTFFQKVTSVFLMLTLFWLTISTSFVIADRQELAEQQQSLTVDPLSNDCNDNGDESANNNVEEKVPSSTNLSEEFLHEHHTTHFFLTVVSLFHKLENSDTYTAFHGELLVPPPNEA